MYHIQIREYFAQCIWNMTHIVQAAIYIHKASMENGPYVYSVYRYGMTEVATKIIKISRKYCAFSTT